MKKLLFTIKDKKSDLNEVIGFFNSERDAQIALTNQVRMFKGKSRLSDYPDDFEVLSIGLFDDEKCLFVNDYKNLGNLSQFIIKDKSAEERYQDCLIELSALLDVKNLQQLKERLHSIKVESETDK